MLTFLTSRVEFQSAEMGALPAFRAATDPGVLGGQYCGPNGLGHVRGHPKIATSSGRSCYLGVVFPVRA